MTARHVHFLGICGYAVSGAALLARRLGYTVTGSDEDAYPPTTDTLTAAGIAWEGHHSAENLTRHGIPDLVVVGNQVRPGNVEWEAAVARGLPVTSEAEFYGELTRDRVRIAVCGTHGKTTTSALLALMLDRAGMDPGFRLGVTSRDFGASARLGTGAPFVFEGDEYTTAPWDARPKFLHAHPRAAVVTRLELDHPDVYASFEDYVAPFRELARTMPPGGLLVLNADDAACLALRDEAACAVQTYGGAELCDWRLEHGTVEAADRRSQRFTVRRPEGRRVEVELTLPGVHNAQNAVAALALAAFLGAPEAACLEACRTFRGAARRFEVVGTPGGVTVVDDYAHHPTEVRATVDAARHRFPDAHVLTVYVPHTYSRTLTLLDDYASAFTGSDLVVLGPIEPARERHLAHTVSSADVAERARPSVADVRVVGGAEEAIDAVRAVARPGDVVLCLSVRGFDDLARRMVGALETRHAHP